MKRKFRHQDYVAGREDWLDKIKSEIRSGKDVMLKTRLLSEAEKLQADLKTLGCAAVFETVIEGEEFYPERERSTFGTEPVLVLPSRVSGFIFRLQSSSATGN